MDLYVRLLEVALGISLKTKYLTVYTAWEELVTLEKYPSLIPYCFKVSRYKEPFSSNVLNTPVNYTVTMVSIPG